MTEVGRMARRYCWTWDGRFFVGDDLGAFRQDICRWQLSATHSVGLARYNPRMSKDSAHPLTAGEFARAKASVAKVLVRVRSNYPTLKARAVLCVTPAQCDYDADPEGILRYCPALLLDNDAKHELRQMPKPSMVQSQAARRSRYKRVDELSELLLYRGEGLVELRFDHLDYPEIWKLQADDLVDRERTPISRTSIRVVLGPLVKFSNARITD